MQLAAGARRDDLGRVGGEDGDLGPVYGDQWRNWPTPEGGHVDQIAEVDRAASRPTPTRAASSSAPGTSAELAEDGARAVPRLLPVLRAPTASLSLPALPAQRRHLPRRAVQHRELRAADAHAGAAMRPRASATSSGPAATATSTEPSRAGELQLARAPIRSRCWTSCASRRRSSTTSMRISSSLDYDAHPHIKAPVAV